MEGMGMGEDMVEILFFRDYSEYADYLRTVREAAAKQLKPYMNAEDIRGFLVDLQETTHYQRITFSRIAAHLRKMTNEDQE
jgi:hypothetical protein